MACASPTPTIAELRRYLERVDRHGREQGAVLPFGVDGDRSAFAAWRFAARAFA